MFERESNNTGSRLKKYVDKWSVGKKELTTVFLLGNNPNPRLEKRISFFRQYGAVVVGCGLRQGIEYTYDRTRDDVTYEEIGPVLPTTKDLVARYFASRKFGDNAYQKLLEYHPDVVYVVTIDGLVVADRYKRRYPNTKVIYEIADLTRPYLAVPKNLFEQVKFALVKYLEKRHINCIDLFVVTSPKFYEIYYHKVVSHDKWVFIPNAPDTEVFKEYHKKSSGKFTVGFVGGLRYYPQLKMLVDASQLVGCDVVFAGSNDGSKEYLEFEKYAKQFENIKFTGRFNFEKEAARIYSNLDCVYSLYGTNDQNARIALPNKLYESIICKLPILGSKGTYLGELIDEWGVGLTVSDTDVGELVEALKKLRDDTELRERIEKNCEERYCELGL